MGAHRTGQWREISFESDVLRDNPLGDPSDRPLWVWTPPSYGDRPERRYPSVYVIQGMTGEARAWFNSEPWTTSYPDAIVEAGTEAIVVLVDAFTALGGSQYLDSPAVGRYHTYLCDEIVPFVDERYRTLAAAGHPTIRFLVQRMAPSGVEMLVGVVNDPSFGPVLACGAGGTATELLKDVAVRITPLTVEDARAMPRSLATFPLLDGYRGAPKLDVAALEQVLLRVSQLVEGNPEIAELDLNPVIVHAGGIAVVDARVRLQQALPEALPGTR